ncbi:hypothetical protein [Xanthocytophaga agilis]|uniref:Uncharacterized protein n=1 Tax=Xanthocytophaga agilis TaxID=3048010 RepID=A0AAE3UF89_9BACT|nr:hypothetical protein [Xanthocytophaga agilis]MDJ1501107.1 hypothetical protein [Xanthocytophaga agilis]
MEFQCVSHPIGKKQMRPGSRHYPNLVPDVSLLAVIGFMIATFYMISSSFRGLGDFNEMHVRLPDTVSWNTCSVIDGKITEIYLDKTQWLCVLVDNKKRNSHLIPMPLFNAFQQTIHSILSSSDDKDIERFVILADKNTKMHVIQRLFDCFQAEGINKFILRVDANSPKLNEYLKFLKAH